MVKAAAAVPKGAAALPVREAVREELPKVLQVGGDWLNKYQGLAQVSANNVGYASGVSFVPTVAGTQTYSANALVVK